MRIISTKEVFASVSAISCGVAPLPTLACRIVKGFAKPTYSLGIKGEGYRAVSIHRGEAGPRGGRSYYVEGFAVRGS